MTREDTCRAFDGEGEKAKSSLLPLLSPPAPSECVEKKMHIKYRVVYKNSVYIKRGDISFFFEK
jgi:hypothetical protein